MAGVSRFYDEAIDVTILSATRTSYLAMVRGGLVGLALSKAFRRVQADGNIVLG